MLQQKKVTAVSPVTRKRGHSPALSGNPELVELGINGQGKEQSMRKVVLTTSSPQPELPLHLHYLEDHTA